MGLSRTVHFTGESPAWDTILAHLTRILPGVGVRMIDGLPAFPDETPAAGWQEVRVGTGAGMVTIRRAGHGFTVVVWGNSDPTLNAAWDRVCWAVAAAGGGTVDTPAGPTSAAEFAVSAGFSAG